MFSEVRYPTILWWYQWQNRMRFLKLSEVERFSEIHQDYKEVAEGLYRKGYNPVEAADWILENKVDILATPDPEGEMARLLGQAK